MGPTRRSIRLTLIAVGLAILLGLLLYRPLLRFMGTVPIFESRLRPAQLIAVISGSLPEIHYGLDLYRRGLGEKVAFIGHFPVDLTFLGKEPFEIRESTWDEIAGRFAEGAGVPRERILRSTAITTSTYERVEALLRVLRDNGGQSVLIVCDPLHSRRVAISARRIARGSATEWAVAPTPASYYPVPYRFDPANWWHSELFTESVLVEHVKLLYYWGRYGW